MLRILFVSKGILKRTGGAEKAVYQILKGVIRQHQIKSIIILTNRPKDTLKNRKRTLTSLESFNEKIPEKNVKIYSIPLIKPRTPIFTDFLDARRFKNAISKIITVEKIDLIHIHTYSAFYITPDNTWKTPIIYSFHDFPIKWPNNPINCFPINYIEKTWISIAKLYWTIILSNKNRPHSSLYFHCNGTDSRDYLLNKGISKQNILLLANGYIKSKKEKESNFKWIQVKLQEIFDPKNKKLKILSVGQLNNIKNQNMLIQGFEEFSRKFKDTILLIVGAPTPIIGAGYWRKVWKNLQKETKRKIIWFGYVSNILLNELYRFADLVILMSHSEASPLVLGECKEMKKPLLSTKVGALRQHLSEELTVLNPNVSKSLSSELEKIYLNKQILKKYEKMMMNTYLPSWNEVGEELCSFYNFIKNQSE